jgi:hypothetical protein
LSVLGILKHLQLALRRRFWVSASGDELAWLREETSIRVALHCVGVISLVLEMSDSNARYDAIEYFELLCHLIIPLLQLYFPTQNLCKIISHEKEKRKAVEDTHFSKTTPNTSSTSPASPRPVIRAKQFAAERRCSAARTMSLSWPESDN